MGRRLGWLGWRLLRLLQLLRLGRRLGLVDSLPFPSFIVIFALRAFLIS
jgi:hypothetical protein